MSLMDRARSSKYGPDMQEYSSEQIFQKKKEKRMKNEMLKQMGNIPSSLGILRNGRVGRPVADTYPVSKDLQSKTNNLEHIQPRG